MGSVCVCVCGGGGGGVNMTEESGLVHTKISMSFLKKIFYEKPPCRVANEVTGIA